MISLIQHIEYLMMFNDCVVIPGWGALIASHEPSNMNGNAIERPSRIIGFNSHIDHNDGLLATSLTRRHGITYAEACNIINTNVTTYRQQLATGSEVAFGHIGYFKLNENKKLEFKPMFQNEACDEYFGLKTSIDLQALSTTSGQQGEMPHAVITGSLWRERMKAAASIAAILGVGVLFSTPIIIDRSTQSAGMNLVEVKTMPKQVIKTTPVTKVNKNDNKFVLIDDNGKETPVETSNNEKSEFAEGMPSFGRYMLVINTCNKLYQANSIIKQYAKKGIIAKTVKRGKYHYIVVAQSNNKQELIKIKKSEPDKFKHAWVCK